MSLRVGDKTNGRTTVSIAVSFLALYTRRFCSVSVEMLSGRQTETWHRGMKGGAPGRVFSCLHRSPFSPRYMCFVGVHTLLWKGIPLKEE